MQRRDVVYILKEDIEPNELRYSLRTVAEHFPCRYVWFVCGNPEGFKPDRVLEHEQQGGTKWERVRSSLIKVCQNPKVSDEFFLFNDDFFVLADPPRDFVNYSNGTIGKRIRDITKRHGRRSKYTEELRELKTYLSRCDYDTVSFAVHMPMLFEKDKLLKLLTSRNCSPMIRSLYGNVYEIPFVYHKDVKIYDTVSVPGNDWDYVSTSEVSFDFGKVGEWIREMFPNPCKYETQTAKEYNKELYTEDGDDVY